uniref:C2H2-type domain-containing protein n=1 Tax=Astatotilapia calliptera TaxID=8154 RepID=A0AAX7SP54_ASTCA
MFFCCRSTMSELFMECVEEELEPWQKQVPEVHLIEDDDDEPIFVGVLYSNPSSCCILLSLTFSSFSVAPQKVVIRVENGMVKRKCPNCQEEILTEEALKYHMMVSKTLVRICYSPAALNTNSNKRIMLVADFYYGNFEGDVQKKEAQKTNTTFKCQSCLKVLKNNIRFMNHMKHHLELEKQNSESWESHTTCHHCYRQYMTPFQLQCHIESAHSPIESSTNCKICELAFESEQVLLEHMKGNHKPGEMPYVCQVCNYRSSFFSDLETHFRSVHENTKDLLCPFCLKVLRTSHIYMQHYMKHQKKKIHRCGKCRLNFLTYKEKVEHRTHVHKTFRKPKALEGLPPGTKVTIRASLTGKSPALPVSPKQPGFVVSTESLSVNHPIKPHVTVSKSKPTTSETGKAKMPQSKKQNPQSKHNLALRNLSASGGIYTCIECNAHVDDFFSHFPMVSSCGACKYRTSCKVSIGNHMIRFHSTITKNRFLKMDHKKNSLASKFTLVCLSCDLLVDASRGDLMTKHLNDRPNHVCKVIAEKGLCLSFTTAGVMASV